MSIEISHIISNAGDATSYYRGYGPMNALKRQYGIQLHKLGQVMWCDLSDTDIVYIQRPHMPEHVQLIQLAKALNVKVWVDLDDLLCGLTPDNPAFDYFNHFSKNIIFAITAADHVTVSSEHLANEYRKYNHNITIIPNAWNDLIHPEPFAPRQKKNIGTRSVLWRGTDTHILDLEEVKSDIIELSKSSSWGFMGFRPYFLHNVGQKLPSMDVINYMSFMQNMGFNVIAVPLHDSPFNLAKSNIAYLEGAVAGAVCVAPDFPEWRRPGVINYNPATGITFKEAVIKALEESPSGRRQTEAQKFIVEHLMLSKVNRQRAELIQKLTNKKI